MKIDDLIEDICSRICDGLRYPEYLTVHPPSDSKQRITVAAKDGKVFTIEVLELRD